MTARRPPPTDENAEVPDLMAALKASLGVAAGTERSPADRIRQQRCTCPGQHDVFAAACPVSAPWKSPEVRTQTDRIMTAPQKVSTVPCAGWEDEESPEPTCCTGGCSRLDDDGSCPGNTPREQRPGGQAMTEQTAGDMARDFSLWLDGRYPDGLDPEAHGWRRVTKVVSEAAEAYDAWAAYIGENPRKPRGPLDDVLAELSDCVFAALGAIEHLTGHEGRSLDIATDRARYVCGRVGVLLAEGL